MNVLQINSNHSRPSQDLAIQTMHERNISLAILAEPHHIPAHPSWTSSTDGASAITWSSAEGLLCTTIKRGGGV
ncbi:unnamed protein product [Lasius platythorax]|uniref:Uncharacterized protein n=1 Tax=Lasius platythorax TaxID=488582 RepID=A0AAV2MZX4_9HYME